MKVKTSELSGAALDWSVAKATRKEMPSVNQWILWDDYHPTRNWLHCGPLIEQFKLSLYLHSEYEINGEGVYDVYEAGCSADWFVDASTPDPVSTDPKVAICRAVVASRIGDEVDIPDELMESEQ